MTIDDKISAFFAADEAPSVDRAFEADVAEAIARRQFRQTLGWTAALAVAVAAIAFALAPALSDLSGILTTPGLPVAAVVVALGALTPRLADWITRLAPTRS